MGEYALHRIHNKLAVLCEEAFGCVPDAAVYTDPLVLDDIERLIDGMITIAQDNNATPDEDADERARAGALLDEASRLQTAAEVILARLDAGR